MLKPAFALVSMNMTLNSLAFPSPSSIETCLHWQFRPDESLLEVLLKAEHDCNHSLKKLLPITGIQDSGGAGCSLEALKPTYMIVFADRIFSDIADVGTVVGGTNERSRMYLLSTRSVLLPTSTMMTSLPLSARTSSIHLAVLTKDCLSAKQAESLRHQQMVVIATFLTLKLGWTSVLREKVRCFSGIRACKDVESNLQRASLETSYTMTATDESLM